MADYYKISRERLKGFADQARRLGEVTGELTPEQIEDTLRGVEAGGGKPIFESILTDKIENNIVSICEFVPGGILEDTSLPATLAGVKCYYNGVLLPGIPSEMLARYPYAWIRKNTTSGYFDLLLSDAPFYYEDTPRITEGNGVVGKPWYRVEIATAETATAWKNEPNVNYYGWGLDSERTILWSNHDIPNGSATATEIYFEGSEPVIAE